MPFRHLSIVVAFAAVLALGSWGARAGDGVAFLDAIEDLPLMPGLHEAPEGGMVFDTAAGRIVETTASGAVSQARVVDFYAVTLPQLGWARRGETVFVREGELLELEFPQPASAGGEELSVRFSLSPVKTTP